MPRDTLGAYVVAAELRVRVLYVNGALRCHYVSFLASRPVRCPRTLRRTKRAEELGENFATEVPAERACVHKWVSARHRSIRRTSSGLRRTGAEGRTLITYRPAFRLVPFARAYASCVAPHPVVVAQRNCATRVRTACCRVYRARQGDKEFPGEYSRVHECCRNRGEATPHFPDPLPPPSSQFQRLLCRCPQRPS